MLLINMCKDDELSLARDKMGKCFRDLNGILPVTFRHVEQVQWSGLQLRSYGILALCLLHSIHVEIVKSWSSCLLSAICCTTCT